MRMILEQMQSDPQVIFFFFFDKSIIHLCVLVYNLMYFYPGCKRASEES